MNDNVAKLVGIEFQATDEHVYITDGDSETVISPARCVEAINELQNYITKSPALHTLAREVEVPDRHVIRTIIEEMEHSVNEGVTPAQLGFWISELSSVGSE